MGIFNPADILIPKNTPMNKWSVVACDQYTSEKDYWLRVKEYVGGAPSAYNLIFPEAFLDSVDFNEKVSEINASMKSYIDGDIFTEYKNTFVFTERTFSSGLVRHGLIGAVDLEEYDYSADSTTKIRATEATVSDRLPPRVTIRRNAPLELPHILMLINDKDDTVMGPLNASKPSNKVYDFDLMENGGHLRGYTVNSNEEIISRLNSLKTDPLIAVGDGNHSLAAAKKCWDEIKTTLSDSERKTHPMRFALCEVVNLYEDSLVFEPIYRVFFGCDSAKLISEMQNTDGKYSYTVKYVTENGSSFTTFKSDCHVESGAVTEFLENYKGIYGGKLDYIHGEQTAEDMGKAHGNIAFMVKCLNKDELFSTVNAFGPLPKKTFSMGNAEEKRFYTESRKLVIK